jgi:hypothetical protein
MSDKSDCRHPSDGTCSCGATVAVDRVALWEEINRYVAICGGDPSKSINTPRMEAVCRIENVIANRGVVTDEIGRWIRTDASDPLRGAIEADRGRSSPEPAHSPRQRAARLVRDVRIDGRYIRRQGEAMIVHLLRHLSDERTPWCGKKDTEKVSWMFHEVTCLGCLRTARSYGELSSARAREMTLVHLYKGNDTWCGDGTEEDRMSDAWGEVTCLDCLRQAAEYGDLADNQLGYLARTGKEKP